MSTDVVTSPPCWRTIGVWSEEKPTCPELERVVHCRNCQVFMSAGRTLLDCEPPPAYLEEWGKRIAEPQETSAVALVPIVVFRTGGETFALTLDYVREVAEPPVVRRVPHRSSPLLLGVAAFRSELVGCVSLSALLSLPESQDEAQRAIVLGDDTPMWSLPVEEVLAVELADTEARETLPTTVTLGTPLALGVIETSQGRATLIDAERLMETLRRKLA